MNCSMPGSPSQSLLKFMSIESVMLSKHLILCHPLLLIPSVFLSIRVFSSQPALCLRWPKYWSLSVNPSNKYSGLISFRSDWFYLLADQGTLKSLLQHSSKVCMCYALFLLPSIFPNVRVFSNESVLHIRWPKCWSFSFSISPSNEYSVLISFRIDCFDLPAVQGILESSPTPQFKSINSSVFSLLYGPTLTSIHDYWKNHSFEYIDLCQQSDVSAF